MNPKRILFSNDERIVIEDQRVSVTRPSDGDWNLRIDHARYNDSGEYLCQINTSPVKIKRVFLYVQGWYESNNSNELRAIVKTRRICFCFYFYYYLCCEKSKPL